MAWWSRLVLVGGIALLSLLEAHALHVAVGGLEPRVYLALLVGLTGLQYAVLDAVARRYTELGKARALETDVLVGYAGGVYGDVGRAYPLPEAQPRGEVLDDGTFVTLEASATSATAATQFGDVITCELGDWHDYDGLCDAATGTKRQVRQVRRWAPTGCHGLVRQVPCAVDCKMSDWGAWSGCDAKTGTQARKRQVLVQSKNGGLVCGPEKDTHSCPVDCKMASWGQWGGCNPRTNKQTRTRAVATTPVNGGLACGPLSEERTCA